MATKIKNPKVPKIAPEIIEETSEWGNRIAHAFALYTNAVITERNKGCISLRVPFTIVVGKATLPGTADVDFGPKDYGLVPTEEAKKMTDAEIGKTMFSALCDYLMTGSLDVAGKKPLAKCKKVIIRSDYGETYVWNGKTGEIKSPKTATKSNRK